MVGRSQFGVWGGGNDCGVDDVYFVIHNHGSLAI